jgi:hypothetical protein
MPIQTEENAKILLKEIETALACGTKHYTLHGRPLLTAKEIIEALLKDGQIIFKSKGLEG